MLDVILHGFESALCVLPHFCSFTLDSSVYVNLLPHLQVWWEIVSTLFGLKSWKCLHA